MKENDTFLQTTEASLAPTCVVHFVLALAQSHGAFTLQQTVAEFTDSCNESSSSEHSEDHGFGAKQSVVVVNHIHDLNSSGLSHQVNPAHLHCTVLVVVGHSFTHHFQLPSIFQNRLQVVPTAAADTRNYSSSWAGLLDADQSKIYCMGSNFSTCWKHFALEKTSHFYGNLCNI